MNRRQFLTGAVVTAAAPFAHTAPTVTSRQEWVAALIRVCRPVLENLAADTLKAKMPVEAASGMEQNRRGVTHLEAVGRTLAGIAPWIAVDGLADDEAAAQKQFTEWAQKGLVNIVSPSAADHIDFTAAAQNLVDAAFLALGLSRARRVLWQPLPADTKAALVAALASTRKFTPGQNNWLLFSAIVEAFLASIGEAWNEGPIERALTAHETWYKGDGFYGDGPSLHCDYYNSFVIYPMLLAVFELIAPHSTRWENLRADVQKRAARYAVIQERLIAPDGTFPITGRSIAYRCGAFHHLADIALRRSLPAELKPAAVRCALAAVIKRTLSPAATFDDRGWLRIGLAGHQPSLGERYISTGSLYLCTVAFLPLGLPTTDPFWFAPDEPWTSRRIWEGADIPADHAL
jgi:hypothetical protein